MAFGLALVMCWPIWVFDSHFVFADTSSYLRGGGVIWQVIGDFLSAPAPVVQGEGGAGTALSVDASGQSTVGRSFTYSAGVFAVQSVLGLWAIPVVQALFVAVFLVAFVDPDWGPVPLIGLGLVAVLTTLPWFSVYLVPDLFAAVPILFGALLVGPLRGAVAWQVWLFGGLTALAVSFHYGFPPLMAGVAGAVLVWLWAVRGLSWHAVGTLIATVVFAPALNLLASSAVLETASTAPQRLPIPLARSLQDGPAYWYLEEVCPEADLALCEAFGSEIPKDISAFLWDEGGVQSLPPDLLARVREEEMLVIMRAFRAYPMEQTVSLVGNGVKQFFLVGTRDIGAADLGPDFKQVRRSVDAKTADVLRGAGPWLAWVTWLAALPALLLLVTGRLGPREVGILLIVVWGLAVNAAIFGGLSAPVERYQSRVVWLLPMLSALWVWPFWRRR